MVSGTFCKSPSTHEITVEQIETPRGVSKKQPYKTLHRNLFKSPSTHEITEKQVETPRGVSKNEPYKTLHRNLS